MDDKMDSVVNALLSRDSNLLHCFKKIVTGSTSMDYANWLGAFYFSTHMGKNYGKLCKTHRFNNNNFANAEDYNKVWLKVEGYKKGSPYAPLS